MRMPLLCGEHQQRGVTSSLTCERLQRSDNQCKHFKSFSMFKIGDHSSLGACGKPANWSTWWILDGSDDAECLRAVDFKANLNAAVVNMQENFHLCICKKEWHWVVFEKNLAYCRSMLPNMLVSRSFCLVRGFHHR